MSFWTVAGWVCGIQRLQNTSDHSLKSSKSLKNQGFCKISKGVPLWFAIWRDMNLNDSRMEIGGYAYISSSKPDPKRADQKQAPKKLEKCVLSECFGDILPVLIYFDTFFCIGRTRFSLSWCPESYWTARIRSKTIQNYLFSNYLASQGEKGKGLGLWN